MFSVKIRLFSPRFSTKEANIAILSVYLITYRTTEGAEDRLFMDCSSVRSGSPLVRTPPQSISVGGREHETNQIAPQSSQSISEQTHMDVAEDALQENIPTTAPTAQ